MTGGETLKQNRIGSKGERDTRKPEKPSPEPGLAGCETEAHTRVFLCPLKILSVGRPRSATRAPPPPRLSAPCGSLPEGRATLGTRD